MPKNKRATRDQLCRRGNFWTEGMTLTEKDLTLLQCLKKRADELGYTPLVREVPEAGRIKSRSAAGKMLSRQQVCHLKEIPNK